MLIISHEITYNNFMWAYLFDDFYMLRKGGKE